MTIQEIADRLVSLCRQGLFQQAQQELYADNAVSLKPEGNTFRAVEGLAAIMAEEAEFLGQMEDLHDTAISDPIVGATYFSVAMMMDMTLRGPGRIKVDEIGVYKVANGKVVQEQFFF